MATTHSIHAGWDQWPPARGPQRDADGGLPITIETRAATLHARLFGARGEPVVLLPDGPGCGAGYLAPVAALIAPWRRALLLDPRGAGLSLSLDHRFRVGDYVADLEALRVQLGVPRLQLFGHGWGGLLAQLYAAALPDRVATLFLCDAAPGVALEWVWARRHETSALCRARGDRLRLGVWRSLTHLHEELGGDPAARRLYRARWRGWFAEPGAAPPPDKDWLATARSRPEAAVARILPGTTSGALPASVSAPYPVLVLYGEHDLYGAAARETLRDRFGEARHVLVKGAAHVPWLEQPAAFQRELRGFYGLERRRETQRPAALHAVRRSALPEADAA
jgi:proline iminopeptidase